MSTAYLFPGQGSQLPGMGQDLYETYPASRAVFDEADEVLGFSLTSCCFEQGMEVLTPTDVCQPAIFTHSMAAFRALGRIPDVVAGHSVGEYSALVACGALSLADGLRTVRRRGLLMVQVGRERAGTMTAVLGLGNDEVMALCEAASQEGSEVQAANFNAPGQVVISGDEEAVGRAATLAKERGARRVIPLSVSGAFHYTLMQDVQAQFALQIADLPIARPQCPIYLNTTAQATTDPDTIRKSMLRQLTSPVRWMQSLQAMKTEGATHYFEIGPGRVLTGLAKRTLGRRTPVTQIGTQPQVQKELSHGS